MIYKYQGKEKEAFNLIDVNELKYNSIGQFQDCFKIIWTKNDSINLGVDGYRIALQPNHLLFATPLNKLDINIENKDVIIYSFTKEFYCIRDHDSEVSCNGLLFLGSSLPVKVNLTESEQKSFNLLYDFFVEEFNTKDHIQGEMLLVLLKRLLIKSVRIVKQTLPDENMPQSKLDTIRKFNLLVDIHFREKHQVSDYAIMLNMTPKSLSNLFARFFNKSPLKVINERIVLEGKKLLNFSEKNITEISIDLGFEEASHFSKFFKNYTGTSPKQYKEL